MTTALLICCSLLLAAATAVLGLAPQARAEGELGDLTFATTSGRIADNPTFPRVGTEAACPADHAQQLQLSLVNVNATGGTYLLGRTSAGAPYDQGPVAADFPAGTALEARLRTMIPSGSFDGEYEIRLFCRDSGNIGSDYFTTRIQVTGDSWTVKAAAANPTTTTLTPTPARTAPVGAEVTLTAAVTPGDAAGKVTFLDGTEVLGAVDVASGTAELKTSALAAGDHTLTATFTPADPAAYLPSDSPASGYKVTGTGTSPSPDPSETDTPPDLDVTDEDGTPLDVNPTLTTGQTVLVTARGYGEGAVVKAVLTGSEATFPDATADAEGTVADYEFTVPDPLADGSYTLTLTEDATDGHSVEFLFGIGDAPGPGPSPSPSPSDSAGADGGAGDGGATEGSTGGGDSGGSAGSGGSGGGGTGSLASTGVNALTLGLASVLLCGLGTAFVLRARRGGLLRF
ncbi:Ig-like domain-containing protein [Streptomyces sp. NBC_01498]|uniref:Ig-like domain-containing protein n=1 Tax=Streptomyces sp. NBC_01498 TaxID=2975870 RepID=UPI002E7B4B7D|nr:Ig-like domain-containing protein [Streptomyces sp. NBC_01498]WTL26851.1 Ig-like domain-containing protein [Streptomyces sp. NBC_01498]